MATCYTITVPVHPDLLTELKAIAESHGLGDDAGLQLTAGLILSAGLGTLRRGQHVTAALADIARDRAEPPAGAPLH